MKKLINLLSQDTILKCNSSIQELLSKALVKNICDDSRKVSDESLFIAINGNASDGKRYIDNAISKGAKYIIYNRENETEESYIENGIIFIPVKNTRYELAYIASRFFESNLQDAIAVTGTNGKSSTVDIIRQIWTYDKRNAISIGTLGIIQGDGTRTKLSGTLTSPNPIELHKILNSFSSSSSKRHNFGKLSVAIEASSHGIDQHRLDCLSFSVCAFTNFTQDHLDYHKTMDNYWNAKSKLFSELASEKTFFVINSDDQQAESIKNISRKRKIRCIEYGYNANENGLKICDIKAEQTYQKVSLLFFGEKVSFILPLFGKFQVYNALCAAASCYLTGVKSENIFEALEHIHPINGRLELVTTLNRAKRIYIDYAHTPDALKNAILSLREHNPKRIITLFGCGGERDHQKRKIMGQIAENFSDIVIVTDDNPRNESPKEIRRMILDGCNKATEIDDRKKAIEKAIEMLNDGDSLLIAGKGHEDYQQIGNEFKHFSDKEIILNKVSNGV
ncbi:MAG: UDP-N-acetylmuramoyl-L-alanyl-D-glutamate--2,6-diaminopimelate ligase [Alphaproteobacteria bacterium]|nr:UDP-N-acetylmuramoyl-L-alanyl-D-glutamate--2,6-diaminopimelate ligase [Alphaproteobacteria bacterium]